MKTEVGSFAVLSSNDGYNSIVVHARESRDERVELHITVINSAITRSANDDTAETHVPVLSSPLADLTLLTRLMSNWMNDQQPFEFETKSLGGRFGRFEMCLDEDFICAIDKPVFRFTYSELRFAIETRFVVDQSCIRLFVEGLKNLI